MRSVTASQAAASRGIHALSRVNESTISKAHQGMSQRAPARSTRMPEASAAVSSARPQLSVSGKAEWRVSAGRKTTARLTVVATGRLKRSSSSAKIARTAAT